jgi:hypothetical protein
MRLIAPIPDRETQATSTFTAPKAPPSEYVQRTRPALENPQNRPEKYQESAITTYTVKLGTLKKQRSTALGTADSQPKGREPAEKHLETAENLRGTPRNRTSKNLRETPKRLPSRENTMKIIWALIPCQNRNLI